MLDLKAIYLETLAACSPARLAALAAHEQLPRNIVSIGKCAGPLFDGVVSRLHVDDALIIAPAGYPAPRSTLRRKRVLFGSHPQLSDASFEAGDALLHFVDAHDDITFLVSGGGSACVDSPLEPWFDRAELIEVNRLLVDAGLPIGKMNIVRKHLSAIKGGRVGARVRGRCVTLLYSDVGAGEFGDIASGPTLPDTSTAVDAIAILEALGAPAAIVTKMRRPDFPSTERDLAGEVSLIADNGTLVESAAAIAREGGWKVRIRTQQIEAHVDEAVEILVREAAQLEAGTLFAAGGEVTVAVRDSGGRGGRCTELAVRFAVSARREGLRDVQALFGSSDGVDGSSPAAAIVLDDIRMTPPVGELLGAIRSSDTFSAASALGQAIMIPPTGNNLRDLVLLARR